ncbi:glycoside hydrolase family 43 protein [Nemania sp. FL0031]|nr:glycoside hydrolase family 43 protein [Nemania sp. FL0031]
MSWTSITARNANPQMAIIRALLWLLSFGGMVASHQHYDDSRLTLTSMGAPDPYVNSFGGQYYLTFTMGDRIEIWSSNSLVDIEATATRHRIWEPPPATRHSAEIWAPELHAVRGRWYVYYAAADPRRGNKSHRMYVLGGPLATQDPCPGHWEFLGQIYGMPDQWAIDGTVFELDHELYLAYSGWPLDEPYHDYTRNGRVIQHKLENANESGHQGNFTITNSTNATNTTNTTAPAVPPAPGMVQQLFLVRLSHPATAASAPVAISIPQQSWEITRDSAGAHAINEGPQWLASPDGRWQGLAYSCAGSWTHEYKMATLRYRGGPPLSPSSWQKSRGPLLQTPKRSLLKGAGAEREGPFGPGHGSFLDVGGGNVVAVYHATDGPLDGWSNRRARVQRVAFTEQGPYMGKSFGIEGPFKTDGFVARFRAEVAKRFRNGDGKGKGQGETVDLRAFLEARRLEGQGKAGKSW